MNVQLIPYVAQDTDWAERVKNNRLTEEEARGIWLERESLAGEQGVASGVYHSGGWRYDFRDELNHYILRHKYFGLMDVWAKNKTQVRRRFGHATIDIMDVK